MDNEEIAKRVEESRRLHRSGCNCCQAVVLAFADRLPIDREAATAVGSTFGRGLSGMREVCGCVSGMAMVCGLLGHSAEARLVAEQFREEEGDVVCARLLQPGRKPCAELVVDAVRMLSEKL